MAAILSSNILSSNITPSKKVGCRPAIVPPLVLIRRVQAAAALAAFSIDSPLKSVVKIIDDERLPESPQSITEGEHDRVGELREKFVGEVDLPESMSHCDSLMCPDEYPRRRAFAKGLQASLRIVPYPIPRGTRNCYVHTITNEAAVDLANVQESRGLFLDGGRNGLI